MATPDRLSASSIGIVKTRRSHRKSRNGCSECKRRHIRCDERRPMCTNCTIAERICSFPPPPPPQQQQQPPPPRMILAHHPLQNHPHHHPHHHHHHHHHPHHHQLQPQSRSQSQSHSPPDSLGGCSSSHSPSCEPEPSLPAPAPGPWPSCPLDPTAPADSSSCSSSDRYRPASVPPPPTPQVLPSFNESFTSTPYLPPAPPASLFTAQHLILLHHAATAEFIAGNETKVVVDTAIRHAMDAPYLIDQVLALSALHIAITMKPGDPPHPAGSTTSLRHQATELQTRAVSTFTRDTAMVRADDTATCVPRFLFASCLSFQVLAETLRHRHPPPPPPSHRRHETRGGASSFHGFIERMVECIDIHRGMLTVIRPTWNYLMQSELQPLIRISNEAGIAAITLSPGTECLPLEHLIRASTSISPSSSRPGNIPLMDPTSAEACRCAIRRLQWAYDTTNSLPAHIISQGPSGFIVIIPAEYVDVLRTHRPEALVILAYLGVLLHRCRGCWAFGDSGANMVRAIAGYLGPQWHEAMAWPLKAIQTEYT